MEESNKKALIKRFPLQKKSDDRGWLIQNDYPELSNSMKHFILSYTKPGFIRGNHYHLRKKEWFCIVQGRAKLHLKDLQTETTETLDVGSDNLELLEMRQNVVHTLENIGENELIFFEIIDEPFNPDDPDTFSYILKEKE